MPDKLQDVYNAFRKWAESKYGWWVVFSQARFQKDAFRKSAEYQEWLKETAPGWTTPTAKEVAQTEAEAAKRAEEEKLPPRKGEQKVIGDGIYEFRDGKWYRIGDAEAVTTPTPTPAEGGAGAIGAEGLPLPPGSPQSYTDADGRIWNWDVNQGKYVESGFDPSRIYQPPTPRDWTPETLALKREEFEWTKSRAEAEPELQRQQMELQYEKDRQKLIEGLPANDWVRRYFVANQPNPYAKKEVSQIDELGGLLDTKTAAVQAAQAEYNTALIDYQKSGQTGGASPEVEAAGRKLLAAQDARQPLADAWEANKRESRDWTPQQIYPNAPEWLPHYVPGVTAGKMITPQEVPTPSGQQLTAMPTNLLESLASYSKWAGGQMWRPLSDEVRRIREAAALMQPETPRGAGAFRTSPARQWV